MQHTTSADGTRIAFDEHGSGRPVVLTAGALSTGASMRPLAECFAEAGRRAVCWDRRGRGRSGDSDHPAPAREVEDLRAVVEAVGGEAVVLGHSAGAVLALLAATSGVPMTHLVVSEPVLRFGEDEPPTDLADRLQTLVDAGQPDQAVLTFQRENVRLDEEQIEQLLGSPDFASMVELAQTTVHDTRLVAQVSTQTHTWSQIGVPLTVLRGDPAAPGFVAACPRLAAMVPGAASVVVRESHDHALDPDGTVRAVLERLDVRQRVPGAPAHP